LGDGLSRGEEDHVQGVHVAGGIENRGGKVSGADLGQKFRLDIRIVYG
jgi:hypothetical protein